MLAQVHNTLPVGNTETLLGNLDKVNVSDAIVLGGVAASDGPLGAGALGSEVLHCNGAATGTSSGGSKRLGST